MALDPTIALRSVPGKFDSPMESMGQAMQLQGLIQRQQLGQMQMDEHRETRAEKEAVKGAFIEAKGDLSASADLLQARGLYGPALKVRGALAEQAKAAQEGQKIRFEVMQKREELKRTLMAGGASDPSDSGVSALAQKLVRDGIMDEAGARRFFDDMTAIPDHKARQRQFANYVWKPEDLVNRYKPEYAEQDDGTTKRFVDKNLENNPGAATPVRKYADPNTVLSSQTSQRNTDVAYGNPKVIGHVDGPNGMNFYDAAGNLRPPGSGPGPMPAPPPRVGGGGGYVLPPVTGPMVAGPGISTNVGMNPNLTPEQAVASNAAPSSLVVPQGAVVPVQAPQAPAPPPFRSKQQAEAEEGAKKAAERQSSSLRDAQSVLTTIGEAKNQVGFATSGLTGLAASKIAGTGAYDLAAKIASLKANLSLSKLQEIKANSPTGGGLGGATSDKDIEMLGNSVAALDIGQSEKQLASGIAKVEKLYKGIVERMGGGSGGAPAFTEQKVNTWPMADKVPPGTEIDLPGGGTQVSDGKSWKPKR